MKQKTHKNFLHLFERQVHLDQSLDPPTLSVMEIESSYTILFLTYELNTNMSLFLTKKNYAFYLRGKKLCFLFSLFFLRRSSLVNSFSLLL